jgi:putative ABC transport system permease protein
MLVAYVLALPLYVRACIVFNHQRVTMLSNYFKVAFRNLIRSKGHSFINIAGLSVGIAVAILIGLWIFDEWSFDRYHDNYKRIAAVKQHVTNNGEVQTWNSVPYPLAEELRNSYGSDFKSVVLASGTSEHILALGDKKLSKSGTFFEPGAPEMFSLQMIKGTRAGLQDPSSILISASVAKAYFGDADPLNQLMTLDNSMQVKVTGVYEDLPRNTTLTDIAFMAPWDLYYSNTQWVKTIADPWRPNAFQVFVQLTDNADMNKVSARIRDVKLKKVNAELAKKKPALFLHPMDEWHLYSDFKNGVNTGGRIQYLWMFGIIGIFVLLLACINFMNLSTAKAEKRAKEVGIRKTIGSLRSQLIAQFFSESLLAVFFSLILAVILVLLLLPFFNEVADKKMVIPWGNPVFWMMIFGFSLLTGLIAGSYPAFYLSSFRPVKVLKGTFKAGAAAALPRKILVVVQFTVSVVLIIGTIVVFRQIEFAKNRPIGYDRDGLLSIPISTDKIHTHADAVRKELTEAGVISAMAEAQGSITSTFNSTSGIDWTGKDPNLSVDFAVGGISYEYGDAINWKFKEGRNFSKEFATDSTALILNEAAVQFIGLKKPVGETIKWFGDAFTIVGVVKDLIIQSPYEQTRPMIYYLSDDPGDHVMLRINPDKSAGGALASVETVFKKFNPEQPFSYQFVDEEFGRKFGNEERVGKLAGFFAALAIFISCLGLFGMASFMAEQRVKEIGVRKVLGASVFNLWGLLSKDFVILLGISLALAIPIAWYFMHNWLQDYYYHYDITWQVFAAAGIGALLITLLTVSFQSLKAALANPVRSLRSQ